MGVYLHYQAMPEESCLFRRLRSELPLCVMYCEVVHHPAGPFDPDRLSHDEFDEFVETIARNPVFGSVWVAQQGYDDLRGELERAESEHPGLRQRAAYFKLSDFDARLAAGLADAGHDPERLAEPSVFGTEQFAPDGFSGRNVTLQYAPPPFVAAAADAFRGVSAKWFSDWEVEWTAFRQVYTEAALRREGIVIA